MQMERVFDNSVVHSVVASLIATATSSPIICARLLDYIMPRLSRGDKETHEANNMHMKLLRLIFGSAQASSQNEVCLPFKCS